jgi:hypothetical protein
MIVMGIRRMGIGAVRVGMMLHGVAARIACMRTDDRDQARDYRADQRQKDDCLDHRRASLRMIFEQTKPFVRENRFPPIGS